MLQSIHPTSSSSGSSKNLPGIPSRDSAHASVTTQSLRDSVAGLEQAVLRTEPVERYTILVLDTPALVHNPSFFSGGTISLSEV